MKNIKLNYGKSGYMVNLPKDILPEIIRKKKMPIIKNEIKAMNDALLSPHLLAPLNKLVRGKKNICVLICDITRPVPNSLILVNLLKKILSYGIDPSIIKILVATGLHRPNLDNELEELVGSSWVFKNFKIENHYANRDIDHIDLGFTKNKTPIKIDRRFVEADLRIVTGLVEPHFMAGYSGGRKVVAPGIAHRDTITTFHNYKFMSDKRCTNCNLTNNPLHIEQLEIINKIGTIYSINAVIDENRNLSFVNFGDIIKSHEQAVNFAEKYTRVKVSKEFDTVLTSASGFPLDKTFYQTVKGIVTASKIVKKNGNLLILSDCSEGLGSKYFFESQRKLVELGVDGFLSNIKNFRFAKIDSWQTQMLTDALKRCNVYLYSKSLTLNDKKFTGVKVIKNIESFINESIKSKGGDFAVIPEGPYVVPYL